MSIFERKKRNTLSKSGHQFAKPRLLSLEERDVPAQFLVTNLNDSGGGSLRQAVLDANAASGDDEVIFQSGLSGTITLETGEMAVDDATGNLTVNGPGASVITVSGNQNFRIFNALTDLNINGLTLTKGFAKSGGGAILSQANLVIQNSIITDNTSGGLGGGIYSASYGETTYENSVTIENSVITNNDARYFGGGIAIYDPEFDCVINNTTISGNNVSRGEGGGSGGGVAFYSYYYSEVETNDGDLLISNSTISGNTAENEGGGVYFGTDNDSDPSGSVLTVINSTISTNTSAFDGGGLYTNTANQTRVLNSTIAYNITQSGVGGGVAIGGNLDANVTLISSIVAHNVQQGQPQFAPFLVASSPPAPSGTPDDLYGGYNVEYSLIESPGTAILNETVPGSNIIGQDPLLGALQNNGGPTFTHALLDGSPAINTGSNPSSLEFDQRGTPFTRTIPTGNTGNTDIGAYEVQPAPPPPVVTTAPFVVGTGPNGGPHVRVLNPATGAVILDFLAYDKAYQGGVNVAVGDVTGDGVSDIVTAPASNGGSDIRVFDITTGQLITNFLAYPGFFGGVYVAVGDVDGDGTADIITGAGKDGGPHVRVFQGSTFTPIRDFLAYGQGYDNGVSVAAADVNGDNLADIITGTATISSHVQVFDGYSLTLITSFLAYAQDYDHGVNVAAADFNGDNLADIVTASGTQSSNVRIYNGRTIQMLANFIAYPDFDGGARVGIAYVDGQAQLATGSGTGGGPHVRIFSGGLSINPNLELLVYGEAFQGGVNVSG